uniref:Uncharacterized protein n=1 Tax=viral metagenome TaxID=1070528 RepID=A0A6C0IV59_9ZZZZ
MFEKANHIHALATVLGTMGGFQEQPDWFKGIAKTSIWQILMSSILVFQGGGNLDFLYSLVVAIVFYILINLTSYIKFDVSDIGLGYRGSGDDKDNEKITTEEESENFLGYY